LPAVTGCVELRCIEQGHRSWSSVDRIQKPVVRDQ
jgi:hypothetical protein